MNRTKNVSLKGRAAAVISEIGCKIKELVSNSTSISSNLESITVTPEVLRVTNSGTISDVTYSLSVYNSGAADGTFLGEVLEVGEEFTFNAGTLNNTYPGGTFTYDATGTEFVIIYNY